MKKSITNSEKFILESILLDSSIELEDRLSAIVADGVNWDEFLIQKHKAGPIIYKKLNCIIRDVGIPEEVLNSIHQSYIFCLTRNLELKKIIVSLAKKLKEARIDYAFFKGAALINTVYKDDIGLRFLSDIDILVKKQDLEAVRKILEPDGFKCEMCAYDYKFFKNLQLIEVHCDIAGFVKYSHRGFFRLAFTPSKEEFLKKIINSRIKVYAEENEIDVLNVEDSILVCCLHFIKDTNIYFCINLQWEVFFEENYESRFFSRKHFFCSLFSLIYDLKTIISKYNNVLDWDSLFEDIKSERMEFKIFSLLYLVNSLLRIDMPKKVIRKIKNNFGMRLLLFLCPKIIPETVLSFFVKREILSRILMRHFYYAFLLSISFYFPGVFRAGYKIKIRSWN